VNDPGNKVPPLLNLLFAFVGRIGRSGFWLAAAICLGAWLLTDLLSLAIGRGFMFRTIQSAVVALMLVCSAAVGIKRLHDRDKSSWWLAVFIAAPVMLIASGLGLAILSNIELLVPTSIAGALAIVAWAVIELGVLRGTVGPNAYGPEPPAAFGKSAP
jgi:uncharacterized membrane protein YhaH (DUF805 family)